MASAAIVKKNKVKIHNLQKGGRENMSNGVIITLIICVTMVALVLISNKKNK